MLIDRKNHYETTKAAYNRSGTERQGFCDVKPGENKHDYCAMILDMRSGSEHIWRKLPKKTRQNVRKASKAGLQIEQGPHLLDDFYRLVALN